MVGKLSALGVSLSTWHAHISSAAAAAQQFNVLPSDGEGAAVTAALIELCRTMGP